jgi:riboflavin biosynthesis pyrimidine reductase
MTAGPAKPETSDAPNMVMLLGHRHGSITAADLEDAYPWPASGRWVRGMMAATLDGASVGADGRSGSISSPVDRAVMAEVRRHCDAILIGAGTFRAERYRPQRPPQELQDAREALGLRAAPTMVLVSRSLDLPWEEDTFRESTIRPLVVTAQSCGAAALKTARRHADVVVLPGERIAVADLMQLLADRLLERVVCEGGPHLLSEIAQAGLLDELDLALSPLMTGGGQIVLGHAAADPARFHLVQAIAADDYLFTRYLHAAAGPSGGAA